MNAGDDATPSAPPWPPHPYARSRVFLHAAPSHVRWEDVLGAFQPCGKVLSVNTFRLHGSSVWEIELESDASGDMALTLLHGHPMPGTSPPYVMRLAHAPHAQFPPPPAVLPLALASLPGLPPAQLDERAAFLVSRRAGPIAWIRVQADVGRDAPGILVQYLDDASLKNALKLFGGPGTWARVINPLNLYCVNFGASVSLQDLLDCFGKYGEIDNSHIVRPGEPTAIAFVGFKTHAHASAARRACGVSTPSIGRCQARFHEPKQHRRGGPYRGAPSRLALDEPRAAKDARTPAETDIKDQARAAEADARAAAEASAAAEQARAEERAAAWRRHRAELARAALESVRRASALRDAEASLADAERARDTAQAQAQAATLAADAAREAREEAERREQAAMLARSEAEEASQREVEWVTSAAAALADARRLWEAAKAVCAAVKLMAPDGAPAEDGTGSTAAENEEPFATSAAGADSSTGAESTAESSSGTASGGSDTPPSTEPDPGPADADTLAESIRKMQELQREEELAASVRRMQQLNEEARIAAALQREEAAREATERQRAAEEAERQAAERQRAAEEAERAAREAEDRRMREEEERRRQAEEAKRARLEAERRAALARAAALAQEQGRCRARDFKIAAPYAPWTPAHALWRFRLVSDEFDACAFSDAQPLTFGGTPWPVLHSAHSMAFEHVEWSAVEGFFVAVRALCTPAEYRELVEKSHRRFHPDRWRARRLLHTIEDVEMRERMECAGNVVAQALTPIWTLSRKGQ